MKINEIRLTGFRCFTDRNFVFSSSYTVVTGPNASGKTSLLEAVSLLTRGRSFRTAEDSTLVREGADGFRISARCVSSGIEHLWEAERFRQKAARRIHRQDGRPIPWKELFPRAPCVALYTDDISLVTGPALSRRSLFNEILCRTDPSYLDAFLNSQRVLKERNAALKKKTPASSTPSMNRPRGIHPSWRKNEGSSRKTSARSSAGWSGLSAA